MVKGGHKIRHSLGDIAGPGDGQAEQLVGGVLPLECLLHFLHLGGNFPGVGQKFRPPVGGDDSLGGTAEDGEAYGLLHILDGLAQRGLAHE